MSEKTKFKLTDNELFVTILNALRTECLQLENIYPNNFKRNSLWKRANKLWHKLIKLSNKYTGEKIIIEKV